MEHGVKASFGGTFYEGRKSFFSLSTILRDTRMRAVVLMSLIVDILHLIRHSHIRLSKMLQFCSDS